MGEWNLAPEIHNWQIATMVEAAVSQSLKAHRQKRSLTIQKLADASGVSRAMISKIERGDAVPTTSVLGKLAEALDTSISQLIGGRVASSAVVVRAEDQPEYRDPRSGFVRRSLSPLYHGRGVDFVQNSLPPGQATEPFPSHRAGVEEHLFVQSGQLAVTVGSEIHKLSAGDFLFYPANQEHSFHNTGNDEAVFFIVIDGTGAQAANK
ncbi:transcriptional regulator, XRE family with cupin sensor [Ruegeria halocynthiae]|uniref:Transcriptional regulator, XRE family with cupin sensor n=1 Tax=Ruegeria halocynthiae TaxID=985054 RepID=A0A1H3G5T4_9RHOB|nr:XRE family transcriptional regulator [Ruegeria halocynthiae]SDX98693.1 transcriptional regulator, XRE family with cupin sensor [Ruegeria halocynthiae]